MTNYQAFHVQLSSIMEALTKAAVTEICGLVDDSYAVLQLEISRSHKENEALRMKLELIETIIVRGNRGRAGNMMAIDGQPATGTALMYDAVAVERSSSSGRVVCTKQSTLRRCGQIMAEEEEPEQSETNEAILQSPDKDDGPDIVLIKEEMLGKDVDNIDTQDVMLLNEDGAEASSVGVDDAEEGPSRMIITATTTKRRDWDRSAEESAHPSEQRNESSKQWSVPMFRAGRRKTQSFGYTLHGSPGELSSSSPLVECDGMETTETTVFDFHSGSNSEVLTAPSTQKVVPFGSDRTPNSRAGSFETKRSVSMISSLPCDVELEVCSSWSNQGLPGMVSMQHGHYLKPDHSGGHSEKSVSDLSFTNFQVTAGSKCDQLDMNVFSKHYICTYCGKSFTSSRSLETHMRVHTGERPYSCAQCGKRFTQSGHLKTHQSVHTGERPFACENCGKRFAGKQNLRIHQQKHHSSL